MPGVGGFFVGGPVGAVAGGIAGGAAVDGITTGVDPAIKGEFRSSGVVESVKNMADGRADAGDPFHLSLMRLPVLRDERLLASRWSAFLH